MDVVVPQIGGEPSELVLSEWLVSVGDDVAAGAAIALIETDKALVEVVTPAAGRVTSLLVSADTRVSEGQCIATVAS